MAMAGAMAPLSAHKCILHSASPQQHCVLRQRLKECRQSVRRNLIVASGNGVQESSQSNDSATKMLRKEEDKEEKIANSNSNPKKPSPLEKEGTLTGDAAEGKDPSSAAVGRKSTGIASGKFADPRWTNGNWDLLQFTKDGKVDWDAVIDAEVMRRKWLEENPEASSNEEPVRFDSGIVPWWAWVRRFHLPQAELLNGRAAMLGFFAAYFIDSLTGIGLVDQTNSFFGKLFLFITVVGVMLVRKNEDIETIKNLIKESTFYDKQWQATWKDSEDKVKK